MSGLHFHPRRAMRGGVTLTNAATYNVAGLYNNTTGSQYLALRSIYWTTPNAFPINFYAIQGNQGLTYQAGVPMVTGDAPGPGQIGAGHIATLPSQLDLVWEIATSIGLYTWIPPIIAVLAPGWGFYGAQPEGSFGVYVNFIWEYLRAEELDEGRWIAANLALAGANGQ